MEFNNTAYNLIVGNNITYSATAEDKQGYNNPAGIYFDNSSNNTIYHNNFEISIGGQAEDPIIILLTFGIMAIHLAETTG